MEITKDIRYIGVNDHEIDLFEGQYVVPNGMAYNSYAILDEKVAIMDSVDVNFTEEWFANMEAVLEGRQPDYLIVQHMEPDHSANIFNFTAKYPEAKVVASDRAFGMMKNFFGTDFVENRIVVGEGDVLSLGNHELHFVTAPMVHWPEVIMTYDAFDKVLFSADAFGKFGALDVEEDWACEARRYYIGIVGKYGGQVQKVLAKAATLDIQKICPLHGPVLTEDLGYYINLYDIWSGYRPEEKGVVINYTSVYGNTKKAVLKLAEILEAKGCTKVVVNDLARCDWAEAVEDAFRYDKMVLATTTYNGEIFPFMKQFIDHLTERSYSNRMVGFIENGSWAPQADRIMKGMLEKSKNVKFAKSGVKILSALDDENLAQLETLAEELVNGLPAEEVDESVEGLAPKKKFICKVCGYVHEADSLPEGFVCPLCKRGLEEFEELK
ncbi:MAG: MBL fold metallo-hydrolase [Firmicutes bacterium]|nr:MBL fold metallo-hydrolase [Bacillota bacterium]